MKRLTGPGAGMIAAIWAAFLPLGLLLPPQIVFQLLNSTIIATALSIAIMYSQGVWEVLKFPLNTWRAYSFLMMGIFFLELGMAWVFTEIMVFRAMHVAILDNTWFAAFGRWMVASSNVALVVSSLSEDGSVPSSAYRKAGVLVALGVGAALVMFSLGLQ